MTEKSDRSRITIDLSIKQTAALNNYMTKHGVSKSDAIRNAIELLMVADASLNDGFKVGAWGTIDGQMIEREFIIVN